MSSIETPEAGNDVDTHALRRIALYVIVGIALIVALWALIEGGERDLWRTPPAFLHVVERLGR